MSQTKKICCVAALAIVLLSLLPWSLGVYKLHVMIVCFFYVMMAASWNLIAGYTGQVSFGHAAFAGIGAYASALLSLKAGVSPWIGVILGTLIAAVLGFCLGVICLKMGGIYLSLTTLGFSAIIQIVIINEYEITRGTMGLQVPGFFAEYSKLSYYYLLLIGALITLAVVYAAIHSRLGVNFRAVQNDERAAASLGVNVVRVRVLAFTISSALAGFAGGLYGHYLLLITPEIPSLDQQFLVLSMTVIGGMGSFAGPIIGAFSLEILSEYIRVYGEYHVLVFGLVALVAARFAPRGIVGIAQDIGMVKRLRRLMAPAVRGRA
ncbi:MAG: branched-chain amino acid ABC transporter permease [Deltaproteobacteria bacterium]|nr:branched-chain amino acid ABC transporter permease [Deltaproteobacteria bacterium]